MTRDQLVITAMYHAFRLWLLALWFGANAYLFLTTINR
jgi:hypothetical protein